MLPIYANFFQNIWQWFNDVLEKLKFDDLVRGFYDNYIAGMDEFFKWALLLFLTVIIILGIITFIKKTFKLFIVLVVIAAIIFIIYKK
ncbi:hypothetical protein [Haploplasma axanthum]|uniref:Uncharacterized protein n=1 Tax=Haploplasma axanthum TaxID=29552 RepID=A0A449BC90_HAPAX|nr:hypothetical protein [Haploplasma axanthum]VEU80064.1 Uncharacterised protein [Haploplasma axanthum]